MQTIHVQVTGRVQGVCFRESTRLEGERLRVSGWVKNCRDGSVEAVLQGEESDILQMISWMKSGPKFASVERLETVELVTEETFSDFSVRYDY